MKKFLIITALLLATATINSAMATSWAHDAAHSKNRSKLVNLMNTYKPSSVKGIEAHFSENSHIHVWARKDYSNKNYDFTALRFTGNDTYNTMHILLKSGAVTFLGFSPRNVNVWYVNEL